MGYTHYMYYDKGFEAKAWKSFQEAAAKVLTLAQMEGSRIEANHETGQMIGKDYVNFNGVDDQAHETCHIEKGGEKFTFCKTAYKDYDHVVVAMFLLAAYYGTGVQLSSDGKDGDDDENFHKGQALLKSATGLDLKYLDYCRKD